ncbi:MAG: hypothetical protein GX666_03495 [Tissierellia bacterium]|nr:hypothetical protein [Tissierellia bacterium]
MDIKVRKMEPRVVNKLNELAILYGISREELLRNVLKDYVDGRLLEENPLHKTLEDSKILLMDVKAVLLSLDNKLRKL